jgi:hypothetical protein
MNLVSLIRGKGKPEGSATATPATLATSKAEWGPTVASVATVAVAKSPELATTREMEGVADNTPEPDREVPCVALEELPKRLTTAARRCCIELHGDDPETVAAMLDDLTYYDPANWDALILHFEAQLSPPAPTRPRSAPDVTCGACAQARASPHPAILRCAAGVESGLATGGFWRVDRHSCARFEGRSTSNLNWSDSEYD